MTVNRIEIKDFLVFSGELAVEFCPGVNVLIGGNATGKTTLLKSMYKRFNVWLDASLEPKADCYFNNSQVSRLVRESLQENFSRYTKTNELENCVYIPEKDILEHAKGLLTFIEQKQTGFGPEYRDILISAQDTPTQEQSNIQKSVGRKITDIIGGSVRWDDASGAFYTLKANGSRIPFASEASAYKKLGYLGLLVSSGQLAPGAVLFWDEPENSLNPELMPKIADILLELAQSGVQIIIATHGYDLARYFDVRKNKNIPVMFHNLSKTDEGNIICNSSPEYVKLTENLLEAANANLFKAVVADALEV